jgi:hypothetical protein
MKHVCVVMLATMLLLCSRFGQAQQTVAASANVVVPTLVSFSGVLTGSNGRPLTNITGVTFSLYAEQEGGAPLWLETQNVQPDKNGNYSVMLGSSTSQGLPSSLFATGQARWLEVQAQGREPQPRVMLLSVPYALKAGDAQTLNGQPASSFMLAPAPGKAGATPNSQASTITGSGTADYLPVFTGTTTIGNSKVYQNASGDIGIGTTSPAATLDVKGKGDVRDTLTLFPKSTDPTLSVNGTAFQVSNKGLVTFVSGQTFPGAGTVTSVGTGLGLKGGPITTSGTLTIDTTVVPQLNTANSFTGNQAVNGSVTATSFSGNGAGLTNVTAANSNELGGLAASAFAQLAAANTFTTNQTINGTVEATAAGNAVSGAATGTTGDTIGVLGTSAGSTGSGVYGIANNTAGTGAGVTGTTSSPSGYGVEGANTASSGLAAGVYGSSLSGAGVVGTGPVVGVEGTGTDYGVFGGTSSGFGVWGVTTSTTGGASGVVGVAQSPAGYGVYATNGATTGDAVGVWATTLSPTGYGIVGKSPDVGIYGAAGGSSKEGSGYGYAGLWGDTGDEEGLGFAGVFGTADDDPAGAFFNNGIDYPTIYAVNDTTSTAGAEVFLASMPNLLGGAEAIIGDPGCGESSGNFALQLGQSLGMSGCTNYTLLGQASGSTFLNANSGEAIYLRVNNANVLTASTGSVSITGNLSATGTKNFKIDHPLDPANKYLYHAAIESSEVLNLYTGNTILDDSGEAVVQLPDWFEAINKDFRYQLTAIGAPGRDLYIAEEVSGGRFKIAGGKPGGKVSWQVTGVRNDAWERAHPMEVEADKGAERGHYLTPELYGAPETSRIGYDVLPSSTEQVVHKRPAFPRRRNASPLQPRAPLSLPIPPMPAPPKVAPLPSQAAQAGKLEVNQK